MKNLCIIHRMQFGYHTDIYKWCQYLKDDYRITVLTFDYGKEKFHMDGVETLYVHLGKNRILNGLRFLLKSIILLSTFKGMAIVSYIDGCRVIKKALPRKKMILDIRTFSIFPNENLRIKKDKELFKTVEAFDCITVISEGLKAKLPEGKGPAYVLPLGADPVDCSEKNFNELNLLYVGTFFNRNIEKTIEGFAKASEKLTGCNLTYTIVGDGPERIDLEKSARELCVSDRIEFTGYIPHEKLTSYLQRTNVGVSFIPISSYYDHQPPTKTFEYALAGSYVIATSTYSNAEVITPENGILIEDSPEAFADAIVRIHEIRNSLSPSKIQSSMMGHTWKAIVEGTMKPILEKA